MMLFNTLKKLQMERILDAQLSIERQLKVDGPNWGKKTHLYRFH